MRIAYIDWKQNFYDEVLSGKRPYVSNLIRAEAERQIAEAGCRTRSDSVRVVEAKNNKVHETEKNFTDSCIDDKKSACYN